MTHLLESPSQRIARTCKGAWQNRVFDGLSTFNASEWLPRCFCNMLSYAYSPPITGWVKIQAIKRPASEMDALAEVFGYPGKIIGDHVYYFREEPVYSEDRVVVRCPHGEDIYVHPDRQDELRASLLRTATTTAEE